jgi:hemolysin III
MTARRDGGTEKRGHLGEAGHALEALVEQIDLKPRLRGWLHFGAGPLAFLLGLGLLVLVPDRSLRLAVAVYVATTVLLFSVSASYHLGAGGPRTQDFLQRLDHANIYLFIAGSYTPFGAALPDADTGRLLLTLVWSIAVAGLTVRVLWRSAPRWLTVTSYIGLGWVSVFFLPELWRAFGPAVVWLMAIGGVLYTVGGVVYARKRPNPAPDWFGFHEIFHALTIAAFLVQFGAVVMVVVP